MAFSDWNLGANEELGYEHALEEEKKDAFKQIMETCHYCGQEFDIYAPDNSGYVHFKQNEELKSAPVCACCVEERS